MTIKISEVKIIWSVCGVMYIADTCAELQTRLLGNVAWMVNYSEYGTYKTYV
jgi:hypothetical protein